MELAGPGRSRPVDAVERVARAVLPGARKTRGVFEKWLSSGSVAERRIHGQAEFGQGYDLRQNNQGRDGMVLNLPFRQTEQIAGLDDGPIEGEAAPPAANNRVAFYDSFEPA
mgnify:CR=1 FL=1